MSASLIARTRLRLVSWSRPCPVRIHTRLASPRFHSTISASGGREREEPYVAYEMLEDVEHPSNYRPGGYHPIQINDRLHQRYKIVHKLGYGAFSTVWLALDEKNWSYVAIKVGTADSKMKKEIEILSRLRDGAKIPSSARSALSMIPDPLDHFELQGPNGTHPCLVTAPARCTLSEAKQTSDNRLFQLDVARSLAAQLAIAISLIHSQGYVHGDLHIGNILLKMPKSQTTLTLDQLYDTFGPPDPEPIIRVNKTPNSSPGVPSHAYTSIWLGLPSDKVILSEAKLLLNDFGVAFCPADESRFESYTPLIIRPPEAILEPTVPLSFPSDIWSLGCIIFELLAHRSLLNGDYLALPDDIMAQRVELQGIMPPEWWDRWEKRSEWFDPEGTPLGSESEIWPWDRRFDEWIQASRKRNRIDVIEEDERAALMELLCWMLAWKPTEMPLASQVLESSWMKKWAQPAYEKGQTRDG